MTDKIVRIGGASAFWGDSAIAAPQLIYGAKVDYLVFDYLAEITMSILARARAKDPNLGYAVDFVSVVMKRLIRDIAEKRIKVIANAGGVNPAACAQALRDVAREAGVDLTIAVVEGDDLLARAEAFRDQGVTEMFSGAPFPENLMSINAYLGGFPIAHALKRGADVVITGRCVDSAIALGPLIHEFGWRPDEHDLMAAGTLAGHIIECGAQATGGLFTDWRDVPDWDNIGYPIVECAADGGFVVTKPDETGGIVTPATVAEQLLYEIGDPQRYYVPDAVCDFTDVKMREIGENRVHVSGARGRPPTATYKVSATYHDGYRVSGVLTIGGFEAAAKARKTGEALIKRTRRMFGLLNLGDYRDTNIEILGAESMYGPHARAEAAREVVLKLTATHDQPEALQILAREISSPGTSMSPGTTGFFGGRPRVSPIVRLFSFLIDKDQVPIRVVVDGETSAVEVKTDGGFATGAVTPPQAVPARPAEGPLQTVPLLAIAHGRSGDKGDNSNIGIIARKPEYLPLIRAVLTPEAVAAHLGHLLAGKRQVERFDLPGINAVNFLLHNSLGGGGVASLRNDPLAKAHAQMLLDFPIDVPTAWLSEQAAA